MSLSEQRDQTVADRDLPSVTSSLVTLVTVIVIIGLGQHFQKFLGKS